MNSLLKIFLTMALIAPSHSVKAAKSPRPNIIIMMADDMGYSDISPYGGEINTPNLAGLAENGVRFTQFYNTARCCPTRAALITGLYPHQAGVGHMMDDRGIDGYRGNLNNQCRTIAEVLKPAGYATYMSGKWHVTRHVAPEGPKFNWPRQRGFDRFFGTIHGAGSFFDPNSLTLENTQIPPGDNFYYTDAISDHAAGYIREHGVKNPDQPFFIYVAFTAPHWPMHARPEDIAKYKSKYDAGWDGVRAARYERMVKMGLIKKDWPLSPRDSKSPAWKEAPDKEWESRLMEVYAAMVDSLDQGVGRIVKALKDTKQFDNTLILFLADNGGCAEGMGRGGKAGEHKVTYRDSQPEEIKPMRPDELQSDMIPRRTRDGKPVRQGRSVMAGPSDTYLGYGLSWANASNTPFREYKHWVHEGGISSPLIAHWPKGISPKRNGQFEGQPAHLIDLMATCVDLAGAKYPAAVKGVKITPLEGVSIAPAFNGKSVNRPNPIFWEHEGNRAVRDGKWKLVAKGSAGAWELYDIDADRTELNNIAAKQPDKVKAMVSQWETYAKRANVLPWIWKPAYGEKAEPGAAKKKRNKKKRFELKPGASLDGDNSPDIAGKSFTVTAEILNTGKDGVIVAQGGSSLGWSLFIRAGKPIFAVRDRGKLTELVHDKPLPFGRIMLTARLQVGADSKSLLAVAGKQSVTTNLKPISSHPIDGLQVGRDDGGLVGIYGAANKFDGEIGKVTIQISGD